MAFAGQAALIRDNTRLKIEYDRRDVYLKTITALTSAIDAKDTYTRNHSRNVAFLINEALCPLKSGKYTQ